jgi:hypothetical protein
MQTSVAWDRVHLAAAFDADVRVALRRIGDAASLRRSGLLRLRSTSYTYGRLDVIDGLVSDLRGA